MPVLGITTLQPCSCFLNNLVAFRSESHSRSKFIVGNDRRLALASSFTWKSVCVTEKVGKIFELGRVQVWRCRLMINAVAMIETSVDRIKEGVDGYQNILRMDIDSVKSNATPLLEVQSSCDGLTQVDDGEKLRRVRISKANKGKTPWNKGRKHSPETIQRIKERTRLAMQDPKVKMKLVNSGHSQSEETRLKIGKGVRIGWERRRQRKMLQQTCYYEWQDLVAEASRKGLFGDEELQWDSYKIMDKQLEQEWLQSVEERKTTRRPKGSQRAPKSAEQKRKIAEAISAKWTDPEYRKRVWSGIAKYHGINEGVERKPKRKPPVDGQTTNKSPMKKAEPCYLVKSETKSQVPRGRPKKGAPSYKDPFASSKLEMIKNIRAQRVATMNQKSEAISGAKLLIAEAEKAAAALELAVQSSPHVQACLLESKMLIAEAIQIIENIENEGPISLENDNDLSNNSTEPVPHDEETMDPNNHKLDIINHRKVNGVHNLLSTDREVEDLSLNKFVLPDLINGYAFQIDLDEPEPTLHQASFLTHESNHEMNRTEKPLATGLDFQPEANRKEVKVIKQWVRGRLVEVVQEI